MQRICTNIDSIQTARINRQKICKNMHRILWYAELWCSIIYYKCLSRATRRGSDKVRLGTLQRRLKHSSDSIIGDINWIPIEVGQTKRYTAHERIHHILQQTALPPAGVLQLSCGPYPRAGDQHCICECAPLLYLKARLPSRFPCPLAVFLEEMQSATSRVLVVFVSSLSWEFSSAGRPVGHVHWKPTTL